MVRWAASSIGDSRKPEHIHLKFPRVSYSPLQKSQFDGQWLVAICSVPTFAPAAVRSGRSQYSCLITR